MGPQAATSSPVSPCVHNSHACLFSHARCPTARSAILSDSSAPSQDPPFSWPKHNQDGACVCAVCACGEQPSRSCMWWGMRCVCTPSLERRCRRGPHSSAAGLPLHAAVLLEFSTFELRPLASPRPSHPLGCGRWVSLNVCGYRKTLQTGKALQGDGDPGGSGIQGTHGHCPG